MKECINCFFIGELIDFPCNRNICNKCLKIESRKYYINNKERIKHRVKNRYENKKEEIKIYKDKYNSENYNKEYHKKYRESKREEIKEIKKIWYIENKDKVKKYQQENKEYFSLKKKENRDKNKDYYNLLNRKYIKEKKENNYLYKLTCSIRCLISQSFKGQYTKKSKKTTSILGCSFEEFKIHIENQFTNDMNWDNYAIYWQLDHKVPISWAKDENDVYKLNHYTNFRPLYWRDNISKGNRRCD